jgi:hypothetical protein
MRAGQHPRLLSDFAYGPSESYRGVLHRDCVVDLCKGFRGFHEFRHGKRLLGVLFDDRLTIVEGYASDLCSPAVRIGKVWIGTPTSDREALAAFVHDFVRQTMRLPCSPWDRKTTDDLFWDFLTERKSRVRRLYHFAVSSGIGSLYIALSKPDPQITCTCHEA